MSFISDFLHCVTVSSFYSQKKCSHIMSFCIDSNAIWLFLQSAVSTKAFFYNFAPFFSSLKIQRIDCVFEKSGGSAEEKKNSCKNQIVFRCVFFSHISGTCFFMVVL